MSRGRAAVAAGAILTLLALVPASAGAAAPAGPAPPLLLTPAIPPDLQALEARTQALQITSLRLSVKLTINPGKGIPKAFAQLFDFSIEGVETASPPAAALKLVLFGSHVRLRIVGGHVYLFSWDLGLRDGGRPWIALGKGPLGKAFGNGGQGPRTKTQNGRERFGATLTLLNDGRNLHELGPAVVDGQAVTGFEVEPEGKATGAPGEGLVGAFSAASHKKAAPKPKIAMRIYFAESGMPVQILILSGSAKEGTTVTADFPAINFPYTIPPPPPRRVISERHLMKLFPPHRRVRRVAVRA
jgi:hypothetical protein